MIYARRYDWRTANPLENTALLDEFVAHPEFLTYPLPPEQARLVGADMLTNTANIVWTTHRERDLTGCVILTRVQPRVNALLHFLVIDKDLVGKRKLLNNLIGYCFTELGFHRLSMEAPEGSKIERFARKALGFRLEGEIRDRNPELPKCLDNRWVARQGSRREQSYYTGSEWKDIVLMRLLASEWVGTGEEGGCQPKLPHQPLDGESIRSSEAADPKTPSPSSPKTSSPSDSRT